MYDIEKFYQAVDVKDAIRALEADNYQGVEAEEVIAMVQEKYRTGVFLACHLLTCTKEGESVEYLKGYLELREAK